MFSRRTTKESHGSQRLSPVNKGAVAHGRQGKTAYVAAGRKPSERFQRKPLQAKSKASQSERIRLADLRLSLEQCRDCDSSNTVEQFNGFKLGAEHLPG